MNNDHYRYVPGPTNALWIVGRPHLANYRFLSSSDSIYVLISINVFFVFVCRASCIVDEVVNLCFRRENVFANPNVGCQALRVPITDTTMSPTAGHRFVSRDCHRDAHVTQLLFV